MRWLALIVALFASPAAAMNLSGAPPKFNIPWGNAAGAPYIVFPIPQPSQIGTTACAASLTDGFPPLTFQATAAGGCGPRGQDFNGILKQITLWNQWAAAGAILTWDSAFATAISGYPLGAFVSQAAQAGCYWVDTLDANASNPDSGGANWTSACPGGGVATAASAGSANAQIVTATPFNLSTGAILTFNPGNTNTAATTLNTNASGSKNILRQTPGGAVAMIGGEIVATEDVRAIYDGTNWNQLVAGSRAFTNVKDQTLSGGVAPVAVTLAGATINLDCGLGPLQRVANNSNITVNAPANDGSCFVQFENGATAGIVTAAGFVNGGSAGDAFDTVNGHKFVVHFWMIHGVASFFVKALQ